MKNLIRQYTGKPILTKDFLVTDIAEAALAVKKIDQIEFHACPELARPNFCIERMAAEFITAYEVVLRE